MRKLLGKVTPTVAAVAVVAVLGAGGGAYAAVSQVAKGSVGSWAIKDGGVKQVDLTPWLQKQLAKAGTPGPQGPAGADGKTPDVSGFASKSDLDGKADANSVTDLQSQVASLESKIEALSGQVDSGVSPANKAWENTNGTAIVGDDGASVQLELAADNKIGSSLENPSISLPIKAGDHITFTYSVSDGAEAGNGAPRVFIVVNGQYYSTIDNNGSLGYGTDNGDGTYTVDVVPVHMNDPKSSPMPSGRVSYAGIVYDNTAKPGTVQVTHLSIAGHELSFK